MWDDHQWSFQKNIGNGKIFGEINQRKRGMPYSRTHVAFRYSLYLLNIKNVERFLKIFQSVNARKL